MTKKYVTYQTSSIEHLRALILKVKYQLISVGCSVGLHLGLRRVVYVRWLRSGEVMRLNAKIIMFYRY